MQREVLKRKLKILDRDDRDGKGSRLEWVRENGYREEEL